MIETLSWIGIALCVVQSALFSGLNLAVFGVSRLRLEAEHALGGKAAARVLALRRDSNATLATILWGNVSTNVLLTLLSDSVLAGVSAFFFSTFVITILGEVVPQAYFSRNALKMASRLSPFLRFYRYALFPVTWTTAWILERWLGPEAAIYWPERNFRELIRRHIHADETDLSHVEGIGALNFLALDDLPLSELGELVDERSVIELPHHKGRPSFPTYEQSAGDPFLRSVQASGKKWLVLVDTHRKPRWVLNAASFLRAAIFSDKAPDPMDYCHHPIVVHNSETLLGEIVTRFEVRPEHPRDYVVDDDVIVAWSDERRIITGADLLGRLLHGVVVREKRGAPGTP